MIAPEETQEKALLHARNFFDIVGAKDDVDRALALTSLISAGANGISFYIDAEMAVES